MSVLSAVQHSQMNEWPVMLCIAEQAFADSKFDFLRLAEINRNWRDAVKSFIKNLAKGDAVTAAAIHDSLSIRGRFRRPPLDYIEMIYARSPAAATRLFYRFHESYLPEHDTVSYADTIRLGENWPVYALWVLNHQRRNYAYYGAEEKHAELVKRIHAAPRRDRDITDLLHFLRRRSYHRIISFGVWGARACRSRWKKAAKLATKRPRK